MTRAHRFLIIVTMWLIPLLAGCGAGGSTSGMTTLPAGAGSAASSSSGAAVSPPAPPASAAVASSTVASRLPEAELSTGSITLDLPAGWSLVSFPLSRIDAVRGLSHQIYTWRDGGYAAVDAGATPAAVDPRRGWFVFLDAPGRIVVDGALQTADEVSIPLQAGWNLVGNPFDRPLSAAEVRVAEGDAVDSVAEAVSGVDPLLHPDVHGRRDGSAFSEKWVACAFGVQAARWVYAAHECDLLFGVAPSVAVSKVVSAVSTGTVYGQVQSTSGLNLSGARISLDSGQTATSASNGTFTILKVPAGTRSVTISLARYNTARGSITVFAGQTRTVYVQLSSTAPPPATGTFYVRAYAWTYGGKRYWVSRIEVNEYNNYSVRWSKSWWSDLGYSAFDLSCTGATIGRQLTIRVTWQNSAGSTYSTTRYRTFSSAGQTEYVYNP